MKYYTKQRREAVPHFEQWKKFSLPPILQTVIIEVLFSILKTLTAFIPCPLGKTTTYVPTYSTSIAMILLFRNLKSQTEDLARHTLTST